MIIDIVKHNRIWLTISVAIAALAVAAIAVWGINFGIDFRGGSILEYTIENKPSSVELESTIEQTGVHVSRIVVFEGNDFQIFLPPLSEDQRRSVETKVEETYVAKLKSSETIGPSVGDELRRQSVTAVIVANVVVILFLAYSFRQVPKPTSGWEFGVAAVIAMLYDVLTVLGVFALLGHFWAVEVDSLFVTAALTVMGFSIHDSIVVFDRIRENLRRSGSEDFRAIVNKSLVETLARSVNLSVSVLIVLFSLLMLGGDSIRWFVFALFIGLFSGTYSSIFVASQVLVWWEDLKEKFGKKN